MWRQLLRDSETSLPGPRGKKRGVKEREEERRMEGGGEPEREEGGEDLALAEATHQGSLGTS